MCDWLLIREAGSGHSPFAGAGSFLAEAEVRGLLPGRVLPSRCEICSLPGLGLPAGPCGGVRPAVTQSCGRRLPLESRLRFLACLCLRSKCAMALSSVGHSGACRNSRKRARRNRSGKFSVRNSIIPSAVFHACLFIGSVKGASSCRMQGHHHMLC